MESKKQRHSPGGMNKVPITPLSRTLTLFTPGAMYHRSMTLEARGRSFLKPSVWCPSYTEMLISSGLHTLVLLSLSGQKNTAYGVFFSVPGLSITSYPVTRYLSCWRPSGSGRMLHNKPMASTPSYVPPKLMSSPTAKRVKCQFLG